MGAFAMFYKEAIGIVWRERALEHETYTGNQRERGTAGSRLPGDTRTMDRTREENTQQYAIEKNNLGETNRPNATIFPSCG